MPYKTNADLPDAVTNVLPADAQSRWREVFNDTMQRHDSEGRAMATAWRVVGQGWKKGTAGRWVRKAEDASTPAPPGDRRTGSARNPPGSASGAGGGITIDAQTETALRRKVEQHNRQHSEGEKRATVGQLKAVYRRGAGAFSVSHRPGMTRNQWAMGRVNAYLRLLSSGRPSNPKYVSDNDLLPGGHSRSTRKGDDVAKSESFTPPEAVQAAARRGLELRGKYGRGGLTTQEAGAQGIGSGVARARDLAAGKAVSEQTIRRMVAFFSRHEKNKDSRMPNGEPGAGQIAWALWGGDTGRRWATAIRDRLDRGETVGKRDESAVALDQRLLMKADKQRYTLGVVYEPDEVDTQNDFAKAEDIEQACWNFMRRIQGRTPVAKLAFSVLDTIIKALRDGERTQVDVTEIWEDLEKSQEFINDMHRETDWAEEPEIVECYIARGDSGVEGQSVKKGAWLLGVIWPPAYFQKIERGERTGLSMEGRGRKVTVNAQSTA